MAATRYDVCGIGNAIVDIIGRCDDAFLETHGAAKGHMNLVDAETVVIVVSVVVGLASVAVATTFSWNSLSL